MKHCILITAYKDIKMINEFISLIPKEWNCYVHLDKKSPIDIHSIHTRAKAFKKFNIYWGGINHLKAFLYLLHKAYNDGNKYDYYHLVTGQDFFAIKTSDFDNIIGKDGKSYIEIHKCPYAPWNKCWGGGFDILKYHTLASICDVRFGFGRILNKLLHTVQQILKIQKSLPPYPIYGGSVYCSLTNEAVKEVLYSDLSQDLLSRLRNSTNGEEIYFQTILMNSQLKEQIEYTNLRYIDWNCETPPKVLNDMDFDKIIASKKLFCRKIDSNKSKTLLKKIQKHITQ